MFARKKGEFLLKGAWVLSTKFFFLLCLLFVTFKFQVLAKNSFCRYINIYLHRQRFEDVLLS